MTVPKFHLKLKLEQRAIYHAAKAKTWSIPNVVNLEDFNGSNEEPKDSTYL